MVSHQPLSSHGSQVAIVGVGGAGNNLLSQAIDGGISPRNCVAVNTDRSQLSESRAQNKVFLADCFETSSQLSRQRGAQSQLLAYRVAPFTQESDFTILLAGLWGGARAKGGPPLSPMHKEQGKAPGSLFLFSFIYLRGGTFLGFFGVEKKGEARE